MPASIYTLGPADIFVHLRGGGVTNPGQSVPRASAAVYWGTCQLSTEVNVKKYYNNVHNDLGGRQVPFVRIADGVEHELSLTLNRFDMNVWRSIQAGGGEPGNAGIEFATSRGAIHTGITDVAISWRYAFTQVAGLAPADSPLGRHYFSCTLIAARETRVGSRVEELTVLLTASPLYDPASRGFSLFTENPAFFTNLPAVN